MVHTTHYSVVFRVEFEIHACCPIDTAYELVRDYPMNKDEVPDDVILKMVRVKEYIEQLTKVV